MEIVLTVIFVLLGAAVGSFINVCIDRLPAGESIVSPPSRCDSCGRRLSALDLVPVLSYLLLRRRCRYCGASIPSRQLWVELSCAALLGVVFWRYGLTPQFAVTALFSLVFVAIAFIDLEHKLILNKITYPAALLALLLLGADWAFPNLRLFGGIFYLVEPRLVSGLMAAGIGMLPFLVALLLTREQGMGMGDIKLAMLIGLVVAWPMVLIALFIGVFTGGLAAVTLLVLKRRGRKSVMPYGTFLAIGPVVTLLWGNEILYWYLGLV